MHTTLYTANQNPAALYTHAQLVQHCLCHTHASTTRPAMEHAATDPLDCRRVPETLGRSPGANPLTLPAWCSDTKTRWRPTRCIYANVVKPPQLNDPTKGARHPPWTNVKETADWAAVRDILLSQIDE